MPAGHQVLVRNGGPGDAETLILDTAVGAVTGPLRGRRCRFQESPAPQSEGAVGMSTESAICVRQSSAKGYSNCANVAVAALAT